MNCFTLLLFQQTNPIDLGPINNLLELYLGLIRFVYVFLIRFYFVLILFGFVVYATTLHDSLAKILIFLGTLTYFLGPVITGAILEILNANRFFTNPSALLFNFFGISDGVILLFLLNIAELITAICFLCGAILYFTRLSTEMEKRGWKILMRACVLTIVIFYFYMTPLI